MKNDIRDLKECDAQEVIHSTNLRPINPYLERNCITKKPLACTIIIFSGKRKQHLIIIILFILYSSTIPRAVQPYSSLSRERGFITYSYQKNRIARRARAA